MTQTGESNSKAAHNPHPGPRSTAKTDNLKLKTDQKEIKFVEKLDLRIDPPPVAGLLQ
jgi:hypothetical protein